MSMIVLADEALTCIAAVTSTGTGKGTE